MSSATFTDPYKTHFKLIDEHPDSDDIHKISNKANYILHHLPKNHSNDQQIQECYKMIHIMIGTYTEPINNHGKRSRS
jgi:hypothetical protein